MSDTLAEAHRAFEVGQFRLAHEHYEQAHKVQALDSKAFCNLATIALHQDRIGDALALFSQAYPIASDSSDSLHLQGLILLRSGKPDAAAASLEKAVSLAPEDTRLSNTYGHCLLALGKHEEAAKYLYAAAIENGEVFDYWQDVASALDGISLEAIQARYMQPLIDCLRRPEIKLKQTKIQARRLIKPTLATLGNLLLAGDYGALERWCLKALDSADGQLFVAYLENVRCFDEVLEHELTALRDLLTRNLDALLKDEPLDILYALAVQCFLTDYAFFEKPAEDQVLADLKLTLETQIGVGEALNPNLLAVYAAHHPLHTLNGITRNAVANTPFVPVSDHWQALIRLQVEEPGEERGLKQDITRLTSVENQTSLAVQQQYEESPYPRWPGLTWGQGKLPVGFRQSMPTPHPHNRDNANRILIAGCGTGYNAFTFGVEQPEAHITAIDLSRTSLAYGERMRQQLGFENITFYQADILRLPELDQMFDEISCAGVLHHLRDPGEGLRALKEVYTGKGPFHLEVYAESGRDSVVAGIKIREAHGLQATPDDMRRFREIVSDLPDAHIAKGLCKFSDFYSLNELRDLVFNVEEHRFNLLTLSAFIKENGFSFAGMKVQGNVMKLFRQMHADANDMIHPEAWHALELAHPGVFGSMYSVMLSLDPVA